MIEIVACGGLNTVQDLGRRGLRRLGIGTAGAMDELALRLGNLLLGNDEGAAGIEIQTFPFILRFAAGTRLAVTGAHSDRSRLGTRPLLPWWAYRAQAGETLLVARPLRGARTYLTFAGGLDVPVVLGSRSTQLRDGFGGLDGRGLVAGDRLGLGPAPAIDPPEMGVLPPDAAIPPVMRQSGALAVRAIPGADHEAFPDEARRALWTTEWTITAQSDRAGYRLSGEPLLLERPMELRSYGVVAGIVQVPPAGQPIIQLSDANTAGGYPRIAGVIEADLWRLAQAPLGSRIRFVEIDYPRAAEAARPVETYLAEIRDAVDLARRATRRL